MVSSQPRLPKSARKAENPLFARTEPFGLEALAPTAELDRDDLAILKIYLIGAQLSTNNGEAPRLSTEVFLEDWTRAFSSHELSEIVIPQRTLARRRASGEPLTVDETERALRIARIAVEAERVFADMQKAARWLRKPNQALNARTPITLLMTETGARTVEELLGQIDHGFFA